MQNGGNEHGYGKSDEPSGSTEVGSAYSSGFNLGGAVSPQHRAGPVEPNGQKKLVLAAVIAAGLVLIAGAAVAVVFLPRVLGIAVPWGSSKEAPTDPKKSGAQTAGAVAGRVWNVPVGSSPVLGSSDALITLVVFADYQCPFCKKLWPTLLQLRKQYGSQLRIVWKDLPMPFHARAKVSATMAREARSQKGDAGFWKACSMLITQASLEDSDLLEVARKLQMDEGKTQAALAGDSHKNAIEEDTRLAAQAGAQGTPTCFINGRQLAGAQPVEKFQELIDFELVKAKVLVEKGTSPSEVYSVILRSAR